jgi:hypothetical protein
MFTAQELGFWLLQEEAHYTQVLECSFFFGANRSNEKFNVNDDQEKKQNYLIDKVPLLFVCVCLCVIFKHPVRD